MKRLCLTLNLLALTCYRLNEFSAAPQLVFNFQINSPGDEN